MNTKEKLIYTNPSGEQIIFSAASEYHVNMKDVDGLADVRTRVYSTSSMGQDGATYINSIIEPREIEIIGNFRVRKREDINRLRRNMLRLIAPKSIGTLTYSDGVVERSIDCIPDTQYEFSRDDPIFEGFSVRFTCLDPYWHTPTETRNDIALWEAGMEFPADSGLELNADWEIGSRSASQIVQVYNAGDVDTGLRVEFRATGGVSNPKILDLGTGEYLRFKITMRAGDILTVSTGYANKYATLTRDGVQTDALRYLDTQSTFIQLAPDLSDIKYDADTGLSNLEVTLWHHDRYLGV